MKRTLVLVVAGMVLALAGCGSSGGESASRVANSAGTTALSTTTTVAAPSEPATGPATTSPAPSRPGPTMHVALYARAGEVPPGRSAKIDTPAWRASGTGWKTGDVDLVVHPAGTAAATLTTKVRAGASGSWEQTFGLGTVGLGPYVAVASQGSLHAESEFTLPPSGPVEEVVDSGRIGVVTWTLTASRDREGLVCAQLRYGSYEAGRICYAPSEQDFNGDNALRFEVTGDSDSFLLAVGASGVDKLRLVLRSGQVMERSAVEASFTSARFIAVVLPRPPVIRSLAALGDAGNVLTSFTLNS